MLVVVGLRRQDEADRGREVGGDSGCLPDVAAYEGAFRGGSPHRASLDSIDPLAVAFKHQR